LIPSEDVDATPSKGQSALSIWVFSAVVIPCYNWHLISPHNYFLFVFIGPVDEPLMELLHASISTSSDESDRIDVIPSDSMIWILLYVRTSSRALKAS
jgi:hypothetical protein